MKLCYIIFLVSIYLFNIENKFTNASNSSTQGSSFPTWIIYIPGVIILFLLFYYCTKKVKLPENLAQPLLGGQYTVDGQPATRHNIQESPEELENQWKCEVCDFENKESLKTCILCGTERGFRFGLHSPSSSILKGQNSIRTLNTSGNGTLLKEASFNRQRSFSIRRLNMLNARQRGARNRQAWVRRVGLDGKRHWCRRQVLDKNNSSATNFSIPGNLSSSILRSASNRPSENVNTLLKSYSSIAFVSQLHHTESHPDGKMTFKNYKDVDASLCTHGYEITNEDLEILEQVAALPFKQKYSWFVEQTSRLIKPWEEGHLKMRVNRANILVDSMEQLLGIQLEHIHMPLRLEFVGETAIDAGGLKREWISLLTEKLFDETIGLFICAHVESLAYLFNPNSDEVSVDHLLYYRGAGRLLGRALLEGELMKPHLALPVLKHLLGVPITFHDIEFIDQELYKSLVYLKNSSNVDALNIDFTLTKLRYSGEVETIELIPDGKNILVTDENKYDYLRRRASWILLDSYSDQLKLFMLGLFEVLPQELISVFDYQELELVLCGVPSIDMDDWIKYTEVSDDIHPELLKWFWDIVRNFTDEEKARLLQFATGSSRVPVQGFKALTSYDGRLCHFNIRGVPYPENMYPKAHTCFNRIDLPLYKTKTQLEEILSLVINMEVTGFSDE